MITEKEAATKWCPMLNGRDKDTMCISSNCMMWRKVDQIGIGPNGEKRDRDMDGLTKWVDRGYCGLAGKPIP